MMDRPGILIAPSLELATAISSFDQYISHSPKNSAQVGIIHGVEAQTSRDLLYDQLYNMIAQEEREGYRCNYYLRFFSPRTIDESCRALICAWMYHVADEFEIDREVVSIAFSYIDRVLSLNGCKDRRYFKLLSASSLHLAIKVHYPHRLREVGGIIPDLSRGEIALGDIVGMEEVLIRSLTWLVNPSTPQSIILHVLALLHPGTSTSSLIEISNKAQYLAELSVYDYFFITSRKSIVALAALLNASESAGYFPFETSVEYRNDWHTDIENLLSGIGYSIDWHEMSCTRERLWNLYRENTDSESGLDRVRSPNTSSQDVHQDHPSPTSHEMQWRFDISIDDTPTRTKSRRRLN